MGSTVLYQNLPGDMKDWFSGMQPRFEFIVAKRN